MNVQQLPELYSQEHTLDPICPMRLVSPVLPWAWYPVEAALIDKNGEIIPERKGPGQDWLFFGFVDGDFPEWGYFTGTQLAEARCRIDPDWTPKCASQVPNNNMRYEES